MHILLFIIASIIINLVEDGCTELWYE